MRASVTRFRIRGRRLAGRELANARPIVGEIMLCHRSFPRFGTVDVLELLDVNSVTADAVLARLFEPRLLEWHSSGMLFRGFETATEDKVRWSVVQEWRVEIA